MDLNEQKTKDIGAGAVIKAVIIGIILFFILILASALIFSAFMPDSAYIPTVFNIIFFLCAFLVGLKSSGSYSTKGYLRGIAGGIIYIAVLAIIFSFFKKPVTGKTYITYITALLISLTGGIVGVNSK